MQIAGRSENEKVTLFKQYRLSETKTFASFFHPEKEALLQLLNHFQHKTGKFGVVGYPDKLVGREGLFMAPNALPTQAWVLALPNDKPTAAS